MVAQPTRGKYILIDQEYQLNYSSSVNHMTGVVVITQFYFSFSCKKLKCQPFIICMFLVYVWAKTSISNPFYIEMWESHLEAKSRTTTH